ncbi:ComEC/Rec2 family competence protein [Consotaella salsifontis]|uniref:Competence protein ComEC n=1 Tax=Consotaella salsifontis TaxID=1365950 RepID=A0A1T4T0H5_9HYPH|nr:ComEC/Rec2 family competence protein [Consotaella salsifontis]SKA33688.1 competence protein ComEC [Consotaella salsifontis]
MRTAETQRHAAEHRRPIFTRRYAPRGGSSDEEGDGRQGWAAVLGGWMEAESAARSGFFLLPIGLILGVLLTYCGMPRWPYAVSFALAAALLLLSHRLQRPLARTLATLAASMMLGNGLAVHELATVETTVLSGEVTTRIEGKVIWRDRDDRDRVRYRVRVISTERPRLSRPPEEAQILVAAKHSELAVGQTYRGLVRLKPPSGPALPGSYDFAFTPFFEGLGAYGYALGAPEPPTGDAELDLALRLTRLRLAISDHIRSILPDESGGVAAAIVTGERSGISDRVDNWLRQSGLSHLLAISGLHMALVAGFALTLTRAALVAIPGLPLRHPIKKWAAGVALIVAGLYLLISGANVATQRAFVMLAIMLLAVLFDRPAITSRNVALAAMIVVAMTPHAVMTASFQMSFSATIALVGAYGTFTHRSRSSGRRGIAIKASYSVVLFFAGIAISSILASLATAPYSAYHFQRIVPLGLIANLLVLPVFSLWIMPLALLGMVSMPFGLDAMFFRLVGQGLELVFRMAQMVSDTIPTYDTGLVPPLTLLLLTASLLAACLLVSGLRLVAIPLAFTGLIIARTGPPPPELLIFEDGKEIALVDEDGGLSFRKKRPNTFVADQWRKALASGEGATREPGFICDDHVCQGKTRSGLRVFWTDDYKLTGRACDESDVAIVARAINLKVCRSGAALATLKTLRESGSLSVSRDGPKGRALVTPAITNPVSDWNAHRLAPWPERWQRSQSKDDAGPSVPHEEHPSRDTENGGSDASPSKAPGRGNRTPGEPTADQEQDR